MQAKTWVNRRVVDEFRQLVNSSIPTQLGGGLVKGVSGSFGSGAYKSTKHVEISYCIEYPGICSN